MKICDICQAVATDMITFEADSERFDVCESCKQRLKGLLLETKAKIETK